MSVFNCISAERWPKKEIRFETCNGRRRHWGRGCVCIANKLSHVGGNECHLLGLINKEHADVQLGRICFFFGSRLGYMLSLLNQADNGKFIWEGIWKWEGKAYKRIECTLDWVERRCETEFVHVVLYVNALWRHDYMIYKYHKPVARSSEMLMLRGMQRSF